jgi:hypothetical protein
MKKSVFLPVKRMSVILTVILAGLSFPGYLHAQSGAQITAFNFTLNPTYPEVINQTNGTIVVPVYNTASVSSLVANFTASAGAVVRVSSVVQTSGVGAKDYTSGVTFDVTSGDGLATKSYFVTVTKNPVLSDKQLLTFSFAGIPGAVGTVNQTDFTVQVTVPFSQSLTSLTATFTSSPLSTVYVDVAQQTSGATPNDFTSMVVYSVKAENTSLRNYYVTVNKAAASSARVLTSFSFSALAPAVAGVINETSHTVALTVPYATDVTNLVASFTSSPLSIVKIGANQQVSGVTGNNFTNPVTYTVEAENGSTQSYIVTVTKEAASSAKDISSFSFQGLNPPVLGVISELSVITLTVPFGTPLGALVATFSNAPLSTVSIGAVTQTSGVTANDFSSDKVYTVTAQNVSTKNYTVHVEVQPALTGKSILTFGFLDLTPDVIGNINETNKTISLTVPFVTDISSLVPTFTSSAGSTVWVGGTTPTSGVTPQNFLAPVVYSCAAQDLTTQDYTVTVHRAAASTANSILSFNFETGFSPIITGTINQPAKTIALIVPYSAVLTSVVATFTNSPLSIVTVESVLQVSGVSANNFTIPVVYRCTAQDGSFELYTVTVTKAPVSTGNRLLSFDFNTGFPSPIIGVISGNTATLTVPNSTDVTSLIATFTTSPFSKLSIGALNQVSGVTPNNFTNPIQYTCTAEDGSFDFYTVTVVKAPVQTGREILTFSFEGIVPGVAGVINQTTRNITVNVPFTTDVTTLAATFTASPLATVRVGPTVQISGVSINNFTSPVTYTVTAENTLSQTYVVTVTKIPLSTAKSITDFRFTGILISPIVGVIDQTAGTITVTIPRCTPLDSLKAVFTASPLAVVKIGNTVQVSGTTKNNFNTPLVYDVMAEDASHKLYTVTVNIVPTVRQFLTFKFDTNTVIGTDTIRYVANGTINNTTRVIQVNIPNSAQKSSLKAVFTVSPTVRVYIGNVEQSSGVTVNDFTSTRSYLLSAEDNCNTLEYLVTVTNNPIDTQKQILAFSFNGLAPVVNALVNEATKTITAVIPFGVNRAGLVATYTTTSALTRVKVGGVMQKSAQTANDFTNPVVYQCYDESGGIVEYTVTVTNGAGSSAKAMTYFAFEDLTPDVIGVINEAQGTITATVPNGTNRSAMRAFFTSSPLSLVKIGTTVQQSGVTVNNFLMQVSYQVFAQDGSIKAYTVNIGETPDTTKPVVTNAIQTVSNLPGQYVLARSNEATGKIYIIKENVDQTTIAHLEAAVTAGNGRAVYITAANLDHALSTANLPDGKYYAYTIDAAGNKSLKGTNAITVQDRLPPTVFVAAQARVNSLGSVVYVQSSESNSIVYLVLEGVPQQSKLQLDAAVLAKQGAKQFAGSANSDVPVSIYGLVGGNYRAYAVDNSVYNNRSEPSANIVAISEASHIKSIFAYSFNQQTPPAIGQITGTEIAVGLKPGIPMNNLIATFTIAPLSHLYVGLIEQVSGVTPNDFTNPVVYKVTAEDGSSQNYTVTVKYNTGIEEAEWMSAIKAYPNPVTDRLVIESARPLSRITVLNGLGQVVDDIMKPEMLIEEIFTGSWTKGLYFIRYYNDRKYLGVQKVIKE